MAKKINPESLIAFELDNLENKVKEFQRYLTFNSILENDKGINYDELQEDKQDKLHKEIVIQIKMQDALFSWLPLLEKLKEGEADKKVEIRGDVELNGLYNRNK